MSNIQDTTTNKSVLLLQGIMVFVVFFVLCCRFTAEITGGRWKTAPLSMSRAACTFAQLPYLSRVAKKTTIANIQ